MPKLLPVPEHVKRALTQHKGYDWGRSGTMVFAGARRLKYASPPVGWHSTFGFRCAICLSGQHLRVWAISRRWGRGASKHEGIIPVCDDCWKGDAHAE